ncbi:DUF6261 family protein [Aquimarina sp. MMG016]|uniref:DUF6261 family protein n=1 Tax=Aquimarina sp. MMG016 TaxID=2822690 RepID=UPI001B39EE38|nr:DUF6261 family protein [Aquimarina sp. MMG016]MBQ4820020.1 hypothetical protein [Aquimarina sp. MMG016]
MNTPYLNRYRNGEYLQYMTDFSELLNKQDLDALQLTETKAILDPLVSKIDAAFKQSQGSGLTQEVIALDERRDRAIVGLRGITDSFKYHFDKSISDAADVLNNIIVSHGDNIQRLSYQEETAVINSIVKDMETEAEATAAVTTLNLDTWLTELKESNADFSTKYLDRVDEAALNPSANIPALRVEATEAYRTLVTHIQAHATLSGAEAYTTILNQVDVLAGQYNQVVDNRSNNGTKDDTPTEE